MLCEVDDVRAFLQKPSSDTEQNAIIESLCSAVGPVVANFCEREFEPPGEPEDEVARTFEYRGGALISLSPYDLRELTGVRIDVDSDNPTVLSPEEFHMPPLNRYGTATWLRLAPWHINAFSVWPQRVVEVTGKWGFPTVPEDVKQAAIITVAIWMRRDVSAFTTVFNLDEAHVERPEALPAAAARMLAPYKRHAYA